MGEANIMVRVHRLESPDEESLKERRSIRMFQRAWWHDVEKVFTGQDFGDRKCLVAD